MRALLLALLALAAAAPAARKKPGGPPRRTSLPAAGWAVLPPGGLAPTESSRERLAWSRSWDEYAPGKGEIRVSEEVDLVVAKRADGEVPLPCRWVHSRIVPPVERLKFRGLPAYEYRCETDPVKMRCVPYSDWKVERVFAVELKDRRVVALRYELAAGAVCEKGAWRFGRSLGKPPSLDAWRAMRDSLGPL